MTLDICDRFVSIGSRRLGSIPFRRSKWLRMAAKHSPDYTHLSNRRILRWFAVFPVRLHVVFFVFFLCHVVVFLYAENGPTQSSPRFPCDKLDPNFDTVHWTAIHSSTREINMQSTLSLRQRRSPPPIRMLQGEMVANLRIAKHFFCLLGMPEFLLSIFVSLPFRTVKRRNGGKKTDRSADDDYTRRLTFLRAEDEMNDALAISVKRPPNGVSDNARMGQTTAHSQ